MPRRPVSFSHLEMIYFPSGFTKGEMIRYYAAIAPYMLPHLKNRPITLIRFPDGVQGEQFYEKNAPAHAPEWIKTHPVPRRHHEGHINYILINNVETLAWCANLGAIEFHPFLHKAGSLETPTHIAFDLDPGEGADLFTCIEVAHLLKEVFAQLDLEAYPKVSGSKGLQVYVPLNTAVTYDATTPFAKTVAEMLEKKHPKLVVSQMWKKLRQGRVLIDWSQNSTAKTTVCVYSMRGKHQEPFISTPVTWAELSRAATKQDRDALFFTPQETLQRAKKKGDLFAKVLTTKQKLPEAFLRLGPAGRGRNPLSRYAAKRDFAKTEEPAPALSRSAQQGKTRRFVIQKHAASHLHYDFRLEMDGTLKSWAVPKGLPYEPGVKRAAIEVEDHPIDYLQFEGTIPQGQYGGGTVMVWDIGTYEVLGGDWRRGDLKLQLAGKKLKGEWHIFRIKRDEGKPVWLVVKSGKPMKPLSTRREDRSVLSGRSMAKIAADNDAQWQSDRASSTPDHKERTPPASRGRQGKKLASSSPEFVEPMKPLLVAALPEGPEWTYEVKWDGFRALLLKQGAKVRILSRNEKSLSKEFPTLAAEARHLSAEGCVLDGEIIALDAAGNPSFQALQNHGSSKSTIAFYAFDLLWLDGEDLTQKPLAERRSRLQEVIGSSDVRMSRILPGSAADVIEAVRRKGLEGVVAKRVDSTYAPGTRSHDWQKVRLRREQDFVVGGYRPGMRPFESVLVGYYEGKKLMFAGKVRPGFTPRTRAALWDLITPDEIATCPFANLPDAEKKGRWGEGITPAEMKTLRWVKPRRVVRIQFAEWTGRGHLRHASFQGIRTDVKPRDVKRDEPAAS